MKINYLIIGALIIIMTTGLFLFSACQGVDVGASRDAEVTSLSRAAICSPSTGISVPYTYDGSGSYCWETPTLCEYINSWGLTTLEINGTSYLNTYVFSSSIPKVNNKYVIHYVSTASWGHFEIAGSCSGGGATTAPTTAPTTAATVTRTATGITRTATRTSTTGSRTATRTTTAVAPTATRTATPAPTSSGSYAYQSCDQWGQYTSGSYIVYNNIWGSGAGSQCLWVKSGSNWGVTASHPSTSGIKSYPNSTLPNINKKVSAIGTLTSSFNCSVPSSGAFSTTYDIWYDNNAYEIMLWMNKTGAVGPIAQSWDSSGNPVANFTNTSVGGHTWNIYRGSNGANQVFSFVRTSNTSSGTVDIKAISNWLKTQGWFGDATLGYVQLGFEITSSPTNAAFTMNSYSVTSN